MDCLDSCIDKYEIEIEVLKEALQKDTCLLNCINSEIEIKKPIEQLFRNHADYVSSSKEVANQKGIVSSLGLTMPDQPAPAHVEYNYYLMTLNFPRDQKLRLNKKCNYKYNDYKNLEQKIICDRIKHLLDNDYNRFDYNIYYELCKDGNLHIHVLLRIGKNTESTYYSNSVILQRDLKIDVNRFYGINSKYFCDVRKVTDDTVSNVKLYLTNKKEKAYQSSGIQPCVNFS